MAHSFLYTAIFPSLPQPFRKYSSDSSSNSGQSVEYSRTPCDTRSTAEESAAGRDQSAEMAAERLPSYHATATNHTEASNPTIAQVLTPAPIEEPPAYSLVDASHTTFKIYGTFIHTPAAPAYQLSRALDQRGPQFRLRRLRPKEVALAQNTPLAFDREGVLYEVNHPPFGKDSYFIKGFRRGCFPGTIELRFERRAWRVLHSLRPGEKGKEILSMKVGTFGSSRMRRKKEEERSEWKDAHGKVFATEHLCVENNRGALPVVELVEGLDQMWRELLLTIWTARLWAAFGEEKTLALEGWFKLP